MRRARLLCVFIMLIALLNHAGEPNTRNGREIMEGQNMALQRGLPEDRNGLWLGEEEAKIYGDLVSFIQSRTSANEPIFVFPNNPEIYFLSKRKNPFPIWNTTISLGSKNETADFFKEFLSQKPSLVIYNRDSVYNTEDTLSILRWVKKYYRFEAQFGGFEIYSKIEA